MVVFFALLFFMPCWSFAFFFGAFTAKADTSDDDLEEAEPSSLGCDGGSATESLSKTGCGIAFVCFDCRLM
jgi:hypothetical protein